MVKRVSKLIKLDLGCGRAVVGEGFTGVDIVKWKDHIAVHDLRNPWPWAANSVAEVFCSKMLQYFTPEQRIHFVNELHRVLLKGAKAQIIVPHWAASPAYMDPMVAMPPISEHWLFMLSMSWREENAYWAKGYRCNFSFTSGYGLHPHLHTRSQEYQSHAVTFWKEAAQDLIVTLTKE